MLFRSEFDKAEYSFYDILIKFISREYIISLRDGEFYLFYRDSRKLRPSVPDLWIGKVEDPDHASHLTASTDMYGFQQIIALSHSSLDNILSEYHLHDKRSWMQLFTKDDFEIRFGAPQLRLLSDKRALVFFHLKSGKLRAGPTSVTCYIAPNMLTYIENAGVTCINSKTGSSPSR